MTLPSRTLRAANSVVVPWLVTHGAGASLLHGQSQLGAVKSMDLALLVDREDDGMSGRVDIEADNVPELVGELRILRQLEGADAVQGELMSLENALDRTQGVLSFFATYPRCFVAMEACPGAHYWARDREVGA